MELSARLTSALEAVHNGDAANIDPHDRTRLMECGYIVWDPSLGKAGAPRPYNRGQWVLTQFGRETLKL